MRTLRTQLAASPHSVGARLALAFRRILLDERGAFVFNKAANDILSDVIALSTDALKMGLATSTWVPNRDDDFVDMGAPTNDFLGGEIAVSGYTGGFGGAGRKTLASKVFTEDDSTDRAKFTSANPTWTALGTGATIAAGGLLKEITNDAASRIICYNDLAAGVPTNGGDFTLTCPANGWFYAQQ